MKLFGFISVYGLLIVTGVILAVIYCSRNEARDGLPEGITIDFVLWALPLGIIGARLYYVVFRWDIYAPDPVSVLYIWQGGLAIYGGIIGGAIGAFALARKRKISFLRLADLVAPSVALAQAVGRWGNFFNGEAYGNVVTDPGLMFFPYAVNVDSVWYQATFFYESVWDLICFLVLHFALKKRLKRPGSLFFSYLALYGVGRFFIEGLRSDSLMWGPVRVSQALSLLLVIGGIITVILREAKNAK